jgi:hypothetical protein
MMSPIWASVRVVLKVSLVPVFCFAFHPRTLWRFTNKILTWTDRGQV